MVDLLRPYPLTRSSMMKWAVLMVLVATATSCNSLGNLKKHNTCHARCLHSHNTHNFVQVGEQCSCKPEKSK